MNKISKNSTISEPTEQTILDKLSGVASELNAITYIDRPRLEIAEQNGTEIQALSVFSLVIKDNINVAGMPTTGCTPALAGNIANSSATAVQRLENAGATVVAKSNMHELAYGITSNNAFSGPTRNPYDPTKIAGGSSGGTAAAIACGAVRAGLGTDTGGSARIPAALCGICGFRPTTGRYPADGVLQISRTRDTIGPLATSIGDIRMLDQVLANALCVAPEVELAELRLGVARDSFLADLDSDVSEVMDATLDVLRAHNVQIIDIDATSIFKINEKVGFPVVLFETPRDIETYLSDNHVGINLDELIASVASPDVSEILQQTIGENAIPIEVYQEALFKHRPELQAEFSTLFSTKKLDALAYPTTPLAASLIGQDENVWLNGQEVPTFLTYIRNCDPSANAGIPSVTLPMGLSSDALPIGLSLDGPMASDGNLLAIAQAIEAILTPIPPPSLK